ncbi:MAG TPA: phosphatase PAP2 family protein [Ktedonobacterales bacterium]|nr:phosphatase PAP2 family protein [Ktedonobacterales bacterium]
MNTLEHIPLPPVVQKRQAAASRWFALAAALLLLFLAYTAILTTGALAASTTSIEATLLGRPITRVDCLFYEWRNLGNPSIILLLTILLVAACLLLGYRWPVLLYLLLLLIACLVCEVVGKSIFTQPIPRAVSYGMAALSCPQLQGQPHSVHLEAAAGLWWKLPPISSQVVQQVHVFARQPDLFGGNDNFSSYPGGHAMRCSFLGVVIAWLCWRHIKPLALRVPVTSAALLIFFSIGLMQLYLGAHLLTDTIAGYLFGLAAGCCAVGLLLRHAPKRRVPPTAEALSQEGRTLP